MFLFCFFKIDNTADPPRDICTNNEVCFAPHTELTKTKTESLNQPATATAAGSRIPYERFLEASQYYYFHEILVAK